MQIGSLAKIIFGSYFLITGSLMLAFRKDLKKTVENMLKGIPEGIPQVPLGRSLTTTILVTGGLSVLVGLVLLVMYFVG